jgi:hypothetical protein
MSIPKDKVLHFAAGAAIGAAFSIAAWCFKPEWVWAAGTVGAALAGIGKDVADFRSRQRSLAHKVQPTHSVDPWDAAATVLGGVLVTAVWTFAGYIL